MHMCIYLCNKYTCMYIHIHTCTCTCIHHEYSCMHVSIYTGGRVTDFYDRRILNTYMQEYFGDFLFDSMQKFYFYKDAKVEYGTPNMNSTCDECASFIESLVNILKSEFDSHCCRVNVAAG